MESRSVPQRLRAKAVALGAVGQEWLRSLPDTVAELASAWELTVGAALDGGSEAYVVAARTADGTEVVLKICLPNPHDPGTEMSVLRSADGHGYVRVLRSAPESRVMLLERLGPSLSDSGLTIGRQLQVLAAALRVAWTIAPPDGERLPTALDKTEWLATFIADAWEAQDRPCSGAPVEQALRYADARAAAYDETAAVLLHGDPHAANALRDPLVEESTDRWSIRFIDPEPFLGEPAYDLGVVLRDWSTELLGQDAAGTAHEWCRTLGALTGVDPRAIWQWAFLERVSTGLYLRHFGHTEQGDQLLAVAERWATTRH